jgi:hypothetical protein
MLFLVGSKTKFNGLAIQQSRRIYKKIELIYSSV